MSSGITRDYEQGVCSTCVTCVIEKSSSFFLFTIFFLPEKDVLHDFDFFVELTCLLNNFHFDASMSDKNDV